MFHIVGMKCGECNSYNTSLDGGPLLRRSQEEDGALTFTPLTDQELAGLSNAEIERVETDLPSTSEESDSDDGWETTEDEDDQPPGDTDKMAEEDLD